MEDTTKIDEAVRVGVAFDNRKVIPIWFRWRNRYYKVENVTYTWSSDQGSGKLRHYAVTNGANTYELCFNSRTMEWILGRVYAD